jgi:hypothetical protein
LSIALTPCCAHRNHARFEIILSELTDEIGSGSEIMILIMISALCFEHHLFGKPVPTFPDRALGGVDSKDSLLGANQIQGCYLGGSLGCEGPFGFERRDVGADGAADYRST